MKSETLTIEGKEIEIKDFLTTIDNNKTELSIKNYTTLGDSLFSLIGVCQTALMCFSLHDDFSELKKQDILGCSSLDISNVLGLVKNLLPLPEMELLDTIRNSN